MLALVRMVNIQSYKDVVFDLSEKINVFEAPNETGKSVIFKVFRTMCDANWYGRGERKSLIRRGCDKGVALLIVPYADGVFKVMFEIYKTYQVYHLFDGEEHVDSWKQDYIPDDILTILGWYYDKDSKVLLNLCDQELDMPFVNSNTRFNYEVMKFIIQNPELEIARDNLYKWIKENTDEIERLSTRAMTLEDITKEYKYVDTASLSNSISIRESAHKKGIALLNILKSLDGIHKLEKPAIVRIDEQSMDRIMLQAEGLRKIGLTLQERLKLVEPTIQRIDEESVESTINSSKKLNAMLYNLYRVRDLIEERNTAYMMLQNATERLRDFERDNDVCPLCGQAFNNHEC